MQANNLSQTESLSLSDKLINGLFSGILAGVVMLGFLLLAGLALGDGLVATLTRFSVPGQETTPLANVFLHLGVSAVYGSAFGVIFHLLHWKLRYGVWKWAAGLAFGLLLYLFASLYLLPVSGSLLMEIPAAVLAAAHALYGLVLGIWIKG
jgi:hypothetical protein